VPSFELTVTLASSTVVFSFDERAAAQVQNVGLWRLDDRCWGTKLTSNTGGRGQFWKWTIPSSTQLDCPKLTPRKKSRKTNRFAVEAEEVNFHSPSRSMRSRPDNHPTHFPTHISSKGSRCSLSLGKLFCECCCLTLAFGMARFVHKSTVVQ